MYDDTWDFNESSEVSKKEIASTYIAGTRDWMGGTSR